jgi:hypothetical protein
MYKALARGSRTLDLFVICGAETQKNQRHSAGFWVGVS